MRSLDRYLDSEGPAPEGWLLGQIAEQYHIPLVSGGAIDQPLALSLELMHMRSYAQVKAAVERAENDDAVPASYYKDLAWEFAGERVKERKAK